MSNNESLRNLLSRLLRDSSGQPGTTALTSEERTLVEGYLKEHGAEIHFWANGTGQFGPHQTEIMHQHYHVSGEPVDIFSLLTEAAMANANLADLIEGAAKFLTDHVPNCPDCNDRHQGECIQAGDWDFKTSDVRLLPLTRGQEDQLLNAVNQSLLKFEHTGEDYSVMIFALRAVRDWLVRAGAGEKVAVPKEEITEAPAKDIIYKVRHQFTLYLQRMKLRRENMGAVQLTETERAFYGAWSQLMFLFRDEMPKLPERVCYATMGEMIQELAGFWNEQKKGGPK